jgi:hypothetical protein
VFDAIGVRFDETPITAEKILDALGKRDNRAIPKDRIGPSGLAGDGKGDPRRALRRLGASTESRERRRTSQGVLVETSASPKQKEPGEPPVGSR